MNQLILERYNYAETETEGFLFLEDETVLYTLERPWIPGHPGGTPFLSCVPDCDPCSKDKSEYELIPHTRPNGDKVYALRNHALGVYYTQEEMGDNEGRYLILLHAGNYANDVVGCVAPGLSRTIYDNRRMVTSSRRAMRRLMEHKHESIIIAPRCGTLDGE